MLRFTTNNFVSWSKPVEVLFLPNGGPPEGDVSTEHPNDGVIWTCKSMDRNDTHYLMIAYVWWGGGERVATRRAICSDYESQQL